MKKLALLFLVLPIPALASPVTELRLKQFDEAKADCAKQDSKSGCVNSYLRARYGWTIVQWSDGSLHAVDAHQGPGPSINPARGY